MIQGIIASQIVGAAGSPAPEGALVFLDFVSGVYFDGALAAAADVIDVPEKINPGTGLELLYAGETTQGSGVANIIGDALAALLTFNWTVVIDYDEQWDTGNTKILTMVDGATTPSELGNYIEIGRDNEGGDHALYADENSSIGGDTRGAHSTGSRLSGRHKIAVTWTDAKIAISADGDTAVTDTTAGSALTATVATLGGFKGDYLYNDTIIRSLTLYAAQSDAALPALSAL